QAEDGIRDFHVTGVQTCALPISPSRWSAFSSSSCVRRSWWIRGREIGRAPRLWAVARSAPTRTASSRLHFPRRGCGGHRGTDGRDLFREHRKQDVFVAGLHGCIYARSRNKSRAAGPLAKSGTPWSALRGRRHHVLGVLIVVVREKKLVDTG